MREQLDKIAGTPQVRKSVTGGAAPVEREFNLQKSVGEEGAKAAAEGAGQPIAKSLTGEHVYTSFEQLSAKLEEKMLASPVGSPEFDMIEKAMTALDMRGSTPLDPVLFKNLGFELVK